MTTFLDISVLGGASAIFAFLLIFALIYSILTFTNIFKVSPGMASLIAFSIAVITLFSRSAIAVIETVIPWYILLMFVAFIILLMTLMFGTIGSTAKETRDFMGEFYGTVVRWILILAIIILVAGLAHVYLGDGEHSMVNGNDAEFVAPSGENVGDRGTEAFIDALFHPRIVGVIAFMVIATFTVMLMSKSA